MERALFGCEYSNYIHYYSERYSGIPINIHDTFLSHIETIDGINYEELYKEFNRSKNDCSFKLYILYMLDIEAHDKAISTIDSIVKEKGFRVYKNTNIEQYLYARKNVNVKKHDGRIKIGENIITGAFGIPGFNEAEWSDIFSSCSQYLDHNLSDMGINKNKIYTRRSLELEEGIDYDGFVKKYMLDGIGNRAILTVDWICNKERFFKKVRQLLQQEKHETEEGISFKTNTYKFKGISKNSSNFPIQMV